MKEKIKLEERYFPNEELNHPSAPYYEMSYCLETVFGPYSSLYDAGCRNGKLLEQIHLNFLNKKLKGCDYFKFAIDDCPESIKKFVYVWDLRDPIDNEEKYDLVVSMEVGEHIDKEYCNIYLNNLKKLSNKYVIMTWAASGGEKDIINDGHVQHLNPLNRMEYIKLLENNGFLYCETETIKLFNEMQKKKNIYFYWKNSIGVFKVNN